MLDLMNGRGCPLFVASGRRAAASPSGGRRRILAERPLGLESFENPALRAKLGRKLIRSWALDAIDYGAEPGAPAEPTQRQVADFLAVVSAAPSKRFKVVGLGETARFIDGQITGGALVFDGRLIQVMAFSLACLRLRQGAHTFT